MMNPLPKLCAANLGGGGILHQIEQGDAPDAAQPGFDISKANGDILAQASIGDGAGWDLQEISGSRIEVRELLIDLVWLRHQLVEDVHSDRHQSGMRDPCAVVSIGGFALLVRANAGEGSL